MTTVNTVLAKSLETIFWWNQVVSLERGYTVVEIHIFYFNEICFASICVLPSLMFQWNCFGLKRFLFNFVDIFELFLNFWPVLYFASLSSN